MHRSLIYDMVFEPLNSWIKDKRSYLYLSWHCQCSIDIKNTNRRRVSRVHGLRGMKMLGYETGYNNVIFSPQPTIRPIPFSFQLYIYSFHCSLRWSNHIILTVIEKVYETLYTLAYSQMLRLVKRSETARSRGLGGPAASKTCFDSSFVSYPEGRASLPPSTKRHTNRISVIAVVRDL